MFEAAEGIKERKGLSYMLVAKFLAGLGKIEKLPGDMVEMCVNKRLLERPTDDDLFKALPEGFGRPGGKRPNDGKMQRPRGPYPNGKKPGTTVVSEPSDPWERAQADEKEVEIK